MTEVEQGRIGSSFDDFPAEEGIGAEVEAQALKEVLAWQIEQETNGPPSSVGRCSG